MTAEDVRSVTFEQVRKGYRPEDVDDFLLQVATDMQRMEAERDTALAERAAIAAEHNALMAERDTAVAAKEDAEAKMYVLAGKVEEYRGQEDTLKTALINAQRMGETVVYEAKQKADKMLHDATGQAEILRQKAEAESDKERHTLESLQSEVKTFKTTILNLYKQHIESLSALDPPVARAEEALEEFAAKEPETPSQPEWDARADLNIEIPQPPVYEETYAPQQESEGVYVDEAAEYSPAPVVEQTGAEAVAQEPSMVDATRTFTPQAEAAQAADPVTQPLYPQAEAPVLGAEE
ncbi:DivIVA domain-containing protein [Clostridia bacterium OttesenSCG-928-O13]|nr:DivIVA domain-containing protein [Clostridia bacterium OttesenSCG-928-O13]